MDRARRSEDVDAPTFDHPEDQARHDDMAAKFQSVMVTHLDKTASLEGPIHPQALQSFYTEVTKLSKDSE